MADHNAGVGSPSEELPRPGEYQPDAELRDRAERLAHRQELAHAGELGEHNVKRLVHELQVHQIELELQNEELRRTQIDLQVTAERYADLYDFAPVGYLSVDIEGHITKANLGAAALLGLERRELAGKHLGRFVATDDGARFHFLRRRLAAPDLTESVELRLQPVEGGPFWARLEIVTRLDPLTEGLLWQVAISNIDEQKRAESLLERVNEELEERVDQRTEQLSQANQALLIEIRRRKEVEAELREREETLEHRVAERTAQLSSLLAVSRDISSSLEIDQILAVILAQLQRMVPYSGCGIFLLHGTLLTLVAYRGPLEDEDLIQSQITLDQSPLLRTVLHRGEPLIVDDMNADTDLSERWRQFAGSLQRQLLGGSRSWLGVPLYSQGRPIGVLQLDHPQPGYLTPQHADITLTLANQSAVAIENARLYGQAQRVAAVEERQRLARELHDSVAQTFYSIALASHAAKGSLRRNPGQLQRHLDQILALADTGLTEMKALIFDLQAEGIRRDGLVQALGRQIHALTARNDLQVEASLGTEPDATLQTKEAAYGIVREALQNVTRHANATQLYVGLSQVDNILNIEVRDNGVGFNQESQGARTIGLRSMRERGAGAGGRVEVTSARGQGTTVRAQLPLHTG